ncbi:PAS domain-containing protein [Methanosarcina sp. T3]|uniref:PAS domain-containing protein n=1 Tax=Methanosarcina sp. T3 TaxID=3439062 RepID=UPI003F86617F
MEKTEQLSQNSTEYETSRQKNLSEDMKLFYSIFENAPLVMMVVNREGKIENINHTTSEVLGIQKKHSLGLLGGELFSCVNSFEDEGCGKNPNCGDCPVRTIVMHTFRTSKNVYKKEGELTIRVNNQLSKRFYCYGSAEGHECPDFQVWDEVNPRRFLDIHLKNLKSSLFSI